VINCRRRKNHLVGTQNNQRWIDRLNGTTNFAHDFQHFIISIALALEIIINSGLVYDLLRGACFRAIEGQGQLLMALA
jgi:myo-inositol-1(or 4)-monophosphatase